MILEEFDASRGIIEPEIASDGDVFEVCETIIMPFSGDLFDQLVASKFSRLGGHRYNINGRHSWYIYEKEGQKVAIMKALLGGPAIVGSLEELKVLGFKKFILFGTCGVLDDTLASNKLILPTSSVRDEGISYHYAPSSDEIGYTIDHFQRFASILDKHNIAYVPTKAWTTDAIFRETADKVKRRKAMGCQVVDMEWSSVCAWALFRQAEVYHFFYTSDYVNHEGEWDQREGHEEADLLTFFDIALKIAKEITND